jgi:hypothetical protein
MTMSSEQVRYYNLNFPDLELSQELIAKQSKLVKKENRTLDQSISNLYLCHATSFFPTDGVIQPRLKFKINLLDPLKSDPEPLKSNIEQLFSILRPTVHFTLNSIVSKHSDNSLPSSQRFIVIDKVTSAVEHISAGYWEDIFCIEPFPLSKEAEILVPDAYKASDALQTQIQALKGRVKIVYYQESEQEALKGWLKDKKADVIRPVENDPDTPNPLGLMGSDRYISSKSFMQTIQKRFCPHDISPVAQIESLIGDGLIYSAAPFLELSRKYSYNVVAAQIHGYIKCAQHVYPLNANQKRFILSYEKAVLLAITILFGAKNPLDLEEEHDKTYVVLKGINLPSIQKKIKSSI